MYSPDVLTSIKLTGVLNHELKLKVGAPVIFLQNQEVCNGTHVTNGARRFILAIHLTPPNKWMSFKFIRKQFPFVLCCVMKINKIQVQSLSKVWLLLRTPMFFHEQLYVTFSSNKQIGNKCNNQICRRQLINTMTLLCIIKCFKFYKYHIDHQQWVDDVSKYFKIRYINCVLRLFSFVYVMFCMLSNPLLLITLVCVYTW